MGGRGQGFKPPVPNEAEEGQARALRIAHRSGGGENYYGRSGAEDQAERERQEAADRAAGPFIGGFSRMHRNRNRNGNGNGFGGN